MEKIPIEEEVKLCKEKMLCCMCHSVHILKKDLKTDEWLCEECDKENQRIYGVNNR